MNADIKTSRASQVDATETGDIRSSSPAPKNLLPIIDVGFSKNCGLYAIWFVYPKGKPAFCVKGAYQLVKEKIKCLMMGVPYVAHWQHFKGGSPWGGVHVEIPNSKYNHFYLEKRHYRPRRSWEVEDGYVSPLGVPLDPVKDKHEKWFLSVHNWMEGKTAEIIATFRKPPRGWIRQLDRFV